ncbi:hypothetical protein [Litoreibacter halocynthiae]|uniref:hypothetical protein n=1 Tax=Litoreibacter halocynthiae TaxID=1242689 RepID=UPI00249331A1|nr:hypothetical protein [Litoreibacter halocynthiae]
MFGLLKGRYEVSHDMQDWIEESFDWAEENGILTPLTRLALPTKDYFPAPQGTPDQVVEGLVANLKPMLGVEDLDVALAPLEVLPDELRHEYGMTSDVAGTWQGNQNGGLIRYDPTLIRKPMALISMLAHELMHQRMARTPRDWPGGEPVEELATDLYVIAAGLGVIQVAGADQAGWQGYMRQPTRAHALAVFLQRQSIPLKDPISYLPPRAGKQLKRALDEVTD